MGTELMILIDVLSIGAGICLLAIPERVYNWGRKDGEKRVPPKNWPVVSRILGIAFIAVGALFIYLDLNVGLGV